MTRTTPPPSHDVAAAFPALAARSQTTVRLHPRPGPDLAVDATKLGGRHAWPPDVPWPRCDRPHHAYDPAAIASFFESPPDGRPYAFVLQLRRDDVPEVGFLDGTDLFQLLWCPASHPDEFAPVVRVFWWSIADLLPFVAPTPWPVSDYGVYVPTACTLDPERVLEYPSIFDLDEDLAGAIWAWEDQFSDEPEYQYRLSVAPGSKVGGFPHWFQDPQWPTCAAGHAMEHLLTVSDHEFDGGSWNRWIPDEEGGLWAGPARTRLAVQEAPGLQLGMGSVYVFICRACADWPIAQVYQR
jgi:hypothetical protein